MLKIIPLKDNGELEINKFESLLSEKTKLVAISHISNSLGTINPIKDFIEKSHKVEARVLIDVLKGFSHNSKYAGTGCGYVLFFSPTKCMGQLELECCMEKKMF